MGKVKRIKTIMQSASHKSSKAQLPFGRKNDQSHFIPVDKDKSSCKKRSNSLPIEFYSDYSEELDEIESKRKMIHFRRSSHVSDPAFPGSPFLTTLSACFNMKENIHDASSAMGRHLLSLKSGHDFGHMSDPRLNPNGLALPAARTPLATRIRSATTGSSLERSHHECINTKMPLLRKIGHTLFQEEQLASIKAEYVFKAAVEQDVGNNFQVSANYIGFDRASGVVEGRSLLLLPNDSELIAASDLTHGNQLLSSPGAADVEPPHYSATARKGSKPFRYHPAAQHTSFPLFRWENQGNQLIHESLILPEV